MDSTMPHKVIHWNPPQKRVSAHNLVGESPLSIYVQGRPFCVGMRTPGQEKEQAAGFCLSQGLVNIPDHIQKMVYDPLNPDSINVILTNEQWEKIAPKFNATYQEGFDLDAEAAISAICQDTLPFLEQSQPLNIAKAFKCLEDLNKYQPLRHKTHSTHATAIYTKNFKLLAAAEDVGRHNGMDKAIGTLFLNGSLAKAELIILSSRISFELVQKAVRAKIPVIFSVSRPTALAVKLADKLGMSLACLAKGGGGYIFCGSHNLEIT